jgi:hypothetical protein
MIGMKASMLIVQVPYSYSAVFTQILSDESLLFFCPGFQCPSFRRGDPSQLPDGGTQKLKYRFNLLWKLRNSGEANKTQQSWPLRTALEYIA